MGAEEDEPALFCGVSRLSWFEPAIASFVVGSCGSTETGCVGATCAGAEVFNERIPEALLVRMQFLPSRGTQAD